MEDKILTIPAVALRGMTILPGMVAHFDISRDKSLRAVEEAMKGDQKLFIVTQKDTEKEDPQGEDLYEVGLLAVVRQVVKLQKNIMRVLIEGIGRAEIYEYTQTADYMQARVIVYDQEDDEQLPEQAKSAMLLSVQETFAKYARVHGKIGQDVMRQVQEETDLLKLLDYVGNSLVISYKKKQKLLEAVTLTARYEAVLSSLLQETEILALKRDFQKKVQEHVDKNQKDYLLREQMQVIREELGESNTETDAQEYEKKLQELQASGEVKARIHKEIERFQGISGNSSESTVSRGYIETLLELPWDAVSEDNKDLKHAQKILDEDHYGLEKVKERILEFLAVRNLTGKGESPIICLVGPPGTGKTSFGLVNILKEALSEPDASVLLVSYTNRAVDEICSKLVKEKIDFIRMGMSLSCDDAYKPYLLERQMESCRKVEEIRNKIQNTRVFVGTTTNLSSNVSIFTLKKFALAIVDEASQILEPHLLALLSAKHGDENAIDRFVLIGDHKQLPAVVLQSETDSAVTDPLLQEIGLTNCRLSLFERLLKYQQEENGLSFCLEKQGRMHPAISSFPNEAFYQMRLRPVPLQHQQQPLPWQ